jgi:biotin carboxyl carrier protein
MKMEHPIQAPFAGTVTRIHFKAGTLAPSGAPLVDLTPS